jgi:hypothetical protein
MVDEMKEYRIVFFAQAFGNNIDTTGGMFVPPFLQNLAHAALGRQVTLPIGNPGGRRQALVSDLQAVITAMPIHQRNDFNVRAEKQVFSSPNPDGTWGVDTLGNAVVLPVCLWPAGKDPETDFVCPGLDGTKVLHRWYLAIQVK